MMNTTWLVIDKYRDAKAQPATTSATKPIAVWGILGISDKMMQYLSSALNEGAALPRRRSATSLDEDNTVRRVKWFTSFK